MNLAKFISKFVVFLPDTELNYTLVDGELLRNKIAYKKFSIGKEINILLVRSLSPLVSLPYIIVMTDRVLFLWLMKLFIVLNLPDITAFVAKRLLHSESIPLIK